MATAPSPSREIGHDTVQRATARTPSPLQLRSSQPSTLNSQLTKRKGFRFLCRATTRLRIGRVGARPSTHRPSPSTPRNPRINTSCTNPGQIRATHADYRTTLRSLFCPIGSIQRGCQPEVEVAVAVVGEVAAPKRRRAVPGIAVPAAASVHTAGVAGPVQVLAPLPDVAVHVVETPRIRLLLRDGVRLAAAVLPVPSHRIKRSALAVGAFAKVARASRAAGVFPLLLRRLVRPVSAEEVPHAIVSTISVILPIHAIK